MSKLTKRERSVAFKLKKHAKLKEQAKALYDKADCVLSDLARLVEGAKITRMRARLAEITKTHHSIRISEDGQLLQLREASADEKGIMGWGHGAVRQFDPKVVNP
jgi:hypothetical protein